jgi:ethanolaminephosphotransferase
MEVAKKIVLGKYIPDERLSNLRNYKYQGVDHSFLSKYILRHFWEYLATLLPAWMAPNLITLIGFSFSFSGFAVVLLASDFMTTTCPAWVYFYVAFVLFAYMTFDALDGKQARRTGTSTPLGQLFDHGCDAINLIFTVFMTWTAFDLHPSMMTAINGTLCYLVFLISTWEEFHTHILFLGPINGPVEGSLLVSIGALISGFLGPEIWHTKVPLLRQSQPLNEALYAAIALGSIVSIAASLRNAIQARGFVAILPSFLASLVPMYGCLLWFGERAPLWQGSFGYVLFLLHTGFTATNSIFRIIIATVTRAPFAYFYPFHVTVIAGLLHCLLCRFGYQLIDDHQLLLICACISTILNIRMALSVIDQVCSYLDISCLRIGGKKKEMEKEE